MYAITFAEPGGPDVLSWQKVADPTPGPGEVIIDVAATAVNRADSCSGRDTTRLRPARPASSASSAPAPSARWAPPSASTTSARRSSPC